jgi:hypothetical protein
LGHSLSIENTIDFACSITYTSPSNEIDTLRFAFSKPSYSCTSNGERTYPSLPIVPLTKSEAFVWHISSILSSSIR